MGSLSIWHVLIILIVLFFLALPVIIMVFVKTPPPNRFGSAAEPMGFLEAVSSFFRNYVNFSGRARRSEYWYSMLFVYLAQIVLIIIDISLFGFENGILSNIFSLGVLLPNIAVTVRRLHDINKSGWFQLIGALIPFGPIILLVLFCTEGSDGLTEQVAEVF